MEFAVRFTGKHDMNGNFFFRNRRLRPYRLPLVSTGEALEAFRSGRKTYIIYDAATGWAIRPSYGADTSLYCSSDEGIRVGSEKTRFSRAPGKGIVRIALFGDSFIHGNEVSFSGSLGSHLEKKMNTQGGTAEVMNFGVPGYGIDQAYLRYLHKGRQFVPPVVILGLQCENIKRDVNMLCPLYNPFAFLPFTKPRYLAMGEGLELLNSPPLPQDKVMPLLQNMASWDLAPHEFWWNKEDYKETLLTKSRFISLLISLTSSEESFYRLRNEPVAVSLKIIDLFRSEVESQGAAFLIVHLPTRQDIDFSRKGSKLLCRDFIKALEEKNTVLKPEALLVKEKTADLFCQGGHYTSKGNEIIAQSIAEHLEKTGSLKSRAPKQN
ncbi:MAG: hypothetical protein RDV48_15470 [Candidatus Eremiobacteraeota bacterium]|nr:hypothetical protein [Candidatus Eremiobacteraeota bacterium]